MPIADKMTKMVEAASMIKKMFEEGSQMKEKYGADNVFDFSLGNPDVPPPAVVKETLIELINSKDTSHGYMPNPGYPHVRQAVAEYLNKEYNVGITSDLIVMTAGAAGALNDILRALLNPGEDILTPAPYFVGYNQYAFVAGGNLKTVASFPDFHLDLDAIENAITENTRVMLINTPKNPTGAVYTKEELDGLGQVLDAGAAGVQMATRFVATEECDAHENFKQAYINAKAEERDPRSKKILKMPTSSDFNQEIDNVVENWIKTQN